MSVRYLLAIVLLLTSGTFLCCTDKPVSNTSTPEQTTPQKPALALGVEIPTLKFADDVRAYMKSVLAAPLPAGYTLPDDVRNAGGYEQSVAKMNEHFPEFLYLENDDMLRAVKANPARFQEYMLEARSVREFYFPGSQPKISK